MKIPKAKQELIAKSLKDGTIKRLGNSCYTMPAHFFILGITPRMISQIDKAQK